VAWLGRHRLGRLLLASLEWLVLPGLAAHHCARKAWLWQRLPSKRRLLWLGVGFDGLGRALLASNGLARVIETDHPDTLRMRRELVSDGAAMMQALQLPAQLGELAAICSIGPTTIVCEGVLMYLPKRAVVRALRRLASLREPPRLIFTALDTTQQGGRGFRGTRPWVTRWLERQREPFRWRCSPARVRRCLRSAGYEIVDEWSGEGFGEYAVEAASAGAASTTRPGPSVPRRALENDSPPPTRCASEGVPHTSPPGPRTCEPR
jgi:hypothetical protein